MPDILLPKFYERCNGCEKCTFENERTEYKFIYQKNGMNLGGISQQFNFNLKSEDEYVNLKLKKHKRGFSITEIRSKSIFQDGGNRTVYAAPNYFVEVNSTKEELTEVISQNFNEPVPFWESNKPIKIKYSKNVNKMIDCMAGFLVDNFNDILFEMGNTVKFAWVCKPSLVWRMRGYLEKTRLTYSKDDLWDELKKEVSG